MAVAKVSVAFGAKLLLVRSWCFSSLVLVCTIQQALDIAAHTSAWSLLSSQYFAQHSLCHK
jgi:hypothetical protein